MKVPPVESYIMVLQPQTPSIEINGTGNVAREYEDFRTGVRVFTDVHVIVGVPDKSEKMWRAGKRFFILLFRSNASVRLFYQG